MPCRRAALPPVCVVRAVRSAQYGLSGGLGAAGGSPGGWGDCGGIGGGVDGDTSKSVCRSHSRSWPCSERSVAPLAAKRDANAAYCACRLIAYGHGPARAAPPCHVAF